MKKAIMLLTLSLVVFLAGSAVNAQNYFTYDGDAFNVYLKTNSDNSQVLEIKFTDAAKTKWIPFEIVDYRNLEDSEVPGFQYEVKDAKGKLFYLDYFRDTDYVIVTNSSTGDSWTLYRRDE